ncbi:amino acid ABC transporter substrate-binding protein (PAAT family) [Stackebrandtia endophytica]|uniref:Amino acid ABC transporter substrate-binding protein (PAAT family) n=1 Tax=Stackebrandtia endophytica TaxID=1496996 RepID=A0A543B2Y2_9ACTN|nr:glutamate ABC transporter substrate-binding protein [Stackebrandtia endophytica]TQL79189.1 amino acid ABC transporter substrate-binding protein (PAAT family) [Stackebrandtia endophytica]
MTNSTLTKRLGIPVLLVVAGLLAGCGAAAPPDKIDPPEIAFTPQGVADPAEVPEETSVDDSCDPLASYEASDSTGSREIQDILDRGRLIVGVDQTTYLLGYRDPLTGKMDGFDIRIARQIALDLFGDEDAIQFKAMSSAEREPALADEDVDLVVRSMTINCARWQNVAFSTEYYRAGQKVLVPADASDNPADLAGQKVCSAEGSTSLLRIEQELGANPVSVRDWADCMILLQQGKVAGMSTDDVILAGMAAQDPNTKVIGERISDEPYGVAANKEHTDLIRYVNATLERIRDDGTWDEIYKATLEPYLGEASAPKAKYRDD